MALFFISDLVGKLLTTMTLATMAQVITDQGLVGDWVDPTGSASIIAGLQTLVGPREAVTGAPQAHLVRALAQVSAALSVAKSTRMEDFQELHKTDHWFDIPVNRGST